MGQFTKKWISFQKRFWITIHFLIWTMCIHKHCSGYSCRPSLRTIASGVRADIAYILSSLLVHTHVHVSCYERVLRSQVLRSGILGESQSTTPLFWFQSLIWKSFAFIRGKSDFQIRKGSESWSKTAFGTWFAPLWTAHCL